MDLILFDENFEEIGQVYPSGDFEVGDADASNDFEFSGENLEMGYGLYVQGEECGGIIEKAKYPDDSSPTFKGWTWRGLLTQDVIQPPAGEDRRTVSGEANTVLQSVISTSAMLSEFFTVSTEQSGVTISSYSFARYCTFLEGLMDMAEANGAKVVIRAKKDDTTHKVKVYLSIAPVQTIEGEYNDDSRMSMTFTESKMGINHLICGGKGDLKDRVIVHLYLQADGSVSSTQYYTGQQERTAFYDYSTAESTEDLTESGTKKLKELAGGKTLQINDETEQLSIGDIVKGRYREKGLQVSSSINKIIYKFEGSESTIEYGLKEDQ